MHRGTSFRVPYIRIDEVLFNMRQMVRLADIVEQLTEFDNNYTILCF